MAKKQPTIAAAIESTEVEAFEAAVKDSLTVAWHIKVDGKRYGPGDTIDIDDATAAPLLASGAILKASHV
jgi:predicted phage tail protein